MKDDLISRQAVIDLVEELETQRLKGDIGLLYAPMIKGVRALPSAQPEIIRCKDCKWFNRGGCAIRIVDDSDKPTENDFCSFAERKEDASSR